jgi:hypothetical protein
MTTAYHLARGCESIGIFDKPSDRDEALLAMLTTEVAEALAGKRSPESSDNAFPYGVDVDGRNAELIHMRVDEDGVIEDLAFVEGAEWVEGDDGDEGCWYRDRKMWDQAMWWHEPPPTTE